MPRLMAGRCASAQVVRCPEKLPNRRCAVFERFTESARRVIFSAKRIAHQVGSPKIETEHLLLGLLTADQRLAWRFLGSPWAADEVWRTVALSKPIGDKTPFPKEIPLSPESKRVLAFAAEEADLCASQNIGTEHLLLGLVREANCFAAQILAKRGMDLASTREDLTRNPFDDSVVQQFVRERDPLPGDVIELQTRIKLIASRVKDAISNHDFSKAREHSDEEGQERDRLNLLYRHYGLPDWLYGKG